MPSSGVKTCARSEEHTSELQSHDNLVCRLLLAKKKRAPRHPPRACVGTDLSMSAPERGGGALPQGLDRARALEQGPGRDAQARLVFKSTRRPPRHPLLPYRARLE